MSASLVSARDHGAIRVLVLQRPEVRNALDTALAAALLDAVAAAMTAAEIAVVVLTGAGGAFSAGADVHEPLDHAGRVRRMELLTEIFEAVGTAPKPTVAAVEGDCVGGGVEIAAACDLRVAGPSARFRFPGAALDVPIGAAKLVGLVGLGTAKDLLLTARTFDAAEAARIGFVQRLAADGAVLDSALDLARQIAANAPGAIAQLRRQLDRFSGAGDRIVAENDVLHAFTEADGDYGALTMPKPGVGSWAGGWVRR